MCWSNVAPHSYSMAEKYIVIFGIMWSETWSWSCETKRPRDPLWSRDQGNCGDQVKFEYGHMTAWDKGLVLVLWDQGTKGPFATKGPMEFYIFWTCDHPRYGRKSPQLWWILGNLGIMMNSVFYFLVCIKQPTDKVFQCKNRPTAPRFWCVWGEVLVTYL